MVPLWHTSSVNDVQFDYNVVIFKINIQNYILQLVQPGIVGPFYS